MYKNNLNKMTENQSVAATEEQKTMHRTMTEEWSGECRRMVMDASPYAILCFNEQGKILEYGGKAEMIFGCSQKDALNRSVQDFLEVSTLAFDETTLTIFITWLATLPAGQSIEMKGLRHNGERFSVEVMTACRFMAGQQIITAFISDSPEKTNHLEELDLIAQAFDAAGPMYITSPEGEIVRVNLAFEQLSGYGREDLLGHSANMLSTGTHESAHLDMMWRAVQQKGSFKGEVYIRQKQGAMVVASISISTIRNRSGVVSHYVAHLSDISEKVRTEEKLRIARRQAELANQAKSRFLATMSHEIRSPLNAIINMNVLLLESPLSEEQKIYADLAAQSGRTLAALIDDILDFSKIESGTLSLYQEWFDFIPLVENAVEVFAAQAREKGLELATVVYPGVPQRCFGDAKRVRQVLMNLIGNAVKYTAEGGVIVRLKAAHPQGLLIEVEDSGIGIDKQHQAQVFNEFEQLGEQRAGVAGGVGLGLAISRHLVELMRGKISVSSQLEEGSLFAVELPCQAEQPFLVSALTQQLRERSLKVVTACANTMMTRALSEQLTALGVSMKRHETTDYAELTNCNEVVYLVDSDDYSSCLSLENQPSQMLLPNWKFVAICPMGQVGATSKALKMGYQSVLRKPIKVEQLISCLTNHSTVDLRDSSKQARSDSDTATERGKILLVEDSAANVAVAMAVLTRSGYQVACASNGQQALELADKESFDLILMDLKMPVMGGLEATQILRERPGVNQDTPIIALTANAFTEDREECIEVGMNDYLSKPLDLVLFKERVNHWMSKKPQTEISEMATDQTESTETLLCYKTLQRLTDDVGVELMDELIKIFIEELSARIPVMREAEEQQDLSCLSAESHALKSSAGSFGAQRLQQLATEVERLAKEGDHSKITEIMQGFESCCADSKAQLEAYLMEISNEAATT